jgi:hypothetical protein
MNKRQRKKFFAKTLCPHGKFMCFACLIVGEEHYPIEVTVTEFKSPGRVVRLEQNALMVGL